MSVGTEWNSPWLNRCYWVMGHLDEFQLNTTEALVLSLIAFFNETGQPVTLEGLSARCFITMEELDELLFGLENRGYLKIRALRGEMVYDMEGLLSTPLRAGRTINEELLQEFQQEFGRTFSAGEMERVMSMAEQYDERAVRVALGEAAVYDKRSLNYIEKLLISWHARGLSPEELENGQR